MIDKPPPELLESNQKFMPRDVGEIYDTNYSLKGIPWDKDQVKKLSN